MSVIILANRWLDRQPEPQRFLIFTVAVFLPLGILSAYAPVTYLATVFVLGGQRLWWLKIGSRHDR